MPVRKIRTGAFETNSSSAHSLVFFKKGKSFLLKDSHLEEPVEITVNKIRPILGFYNRDCGILKSIDEKAGYLYSLAMHESDHIDGKINSSKLLMTLEELMKDLDIKIELDESIAKKEEAFASVYDMDFLYDKDDHRIDWRIDKGLLKSLIFNPNIIFILDGDEVYYYTEYPHTGKLRCYHLEVLSDSFVFSYDGILNKKDMINFFVDLLISINLEDHEDFYGYEMESIIKFKKDLNFSTIRKGFEYIFKFGTYILVEAKEDPFSTNINTGIEIFDKHGREITCKLRKRIKQIYKYTKKRMNEENKK